MMATNIDKGLYAAPQGLEALAEEAPEIEIEIEDPEAVRIGIDGMEIEFEPGRETSEDFDANLAEYLDAEYQPVLARGCPGNPPGTVRGSQRCRHGGAARQHGSGDRGDDVQAGGHRDAGYFLSPRRFLRRVQ